MTREEFDSLKVGDYVIHGFGHVGRVVKLSGGGYVARDPGLNTGDGQCDVSFAWNEGEPCPDYNGPEIKMEEDAYLTRAQRRAKNKKVRFKIKKLAILIASALLLCSCLKSRTSLQEVLYITADGDTLVTYGGYIKYYDNGDVTFIAPQKPMEYRKNN